MSDLFFKTDAVISPCGRYRYLLTRRWSDGPTACFIMLNPSTADAEKNDPTIGRCIEFATREQCGALNVVNLFAWRATNPREVPLAADPVGPDNDQHIREATRNLDGPLIAAWGATKFAAARASTVIALIDRPLICLGKTLFGQPRHPLYVRGDTPLERL